ncbi:MAG: CHAD domain-containing protein [Pseudomonadota bacterium]
MWLRQLAKAARHLNGATPPELATLEMRKCFKRIRALLRLLRPAMAKSEWSRETTRYRDLGRRLAASRDRAVLVETLDRLATLRQLDRDKSVVAVRKCLVDQRDRQIELDSAGKGDPRAAMARDLAAAKAAAERVSFTGLTRHKVVGAYADTYGVGREEMAACYLVGDDDELFHDWRKRVQHHWRQSALLVDIWPDTMVVRVDAARKASKALGLDHDLSLLRQHLKRIDTEVLSKGERRQLKGVIRQLQAQLRDIAEPLAAWLYAIEPEALENQANDWWEAANLAADCDMFLLETAERATSSH